MENMYAIYLNMGITFINNPHTWNVVSKLNQNNFSVPSFVLIGKIWLHYLVCCTQDDKGSILDAKEAEIYDLYLTVMWGLKFATNAASTILKVDQIIMAKRAGGPKPGNRPKNDED